MIKKKYRIDLRICPGITVLHRFNEICLYNPINKKHYWAIGPQFEDFSKMIDQVI